MGRLRKGLLRAVAMLGWYDANHVSCLSVHVFVDVVVFLIECRQFRSLTDPEPQYFHGVLMVFCGQPEIASRLFKSAIGRNYCAYSALQNDPLLVKFRGNPEFAQWLSLAKQCQEKFLKERNEKAP
jgi:hypothetical protein